MNLANFYLVCFLVGVTLSVLSFLGGGLHLPHLHVHTPHVHLPHVHIPHAHIPQGHAEAPGGAGAHGAEVGFFNFASITAFLAWFGAAGYLLTRYSGLVVALVMLLAVGAGLSGAAIISWYLVKFLLGHDRDLDPADYDRVGMLGRIVSPIRAAGTGEIVFSMGGTRQTCGARSEDGEAIARGTEVVITRYERGIAYVRRWDEMAAAPAASQAKSDK